MYTPFSLFVPLFKKSYKISMECYWVFNLPWWIVSCILVTCFAWFLPRSLNVFFMLSLLSHVVRFPLSLLSMLILSHLLPWTMCCILLMFVVRPCLPSLQKTSLHLLKYAMNELLFCYAGTCVKWHALGVQNLWILPLDPLGWNSR